MRRSNRKDELGWFAAGRERKEYLQNPDRILLGAYDDGMPGSLEGFGDLESALGRRLPLIHFYTAWGDKPEQQFPAQLAEAIWRLGSVPVVTWEPWLTDFSAEAHPELPAREERERGGLAAIARGDYDFHIDAWARAARDFDRPLYVRFGHEMNDPYRYPWGPHKNAKEDFVRAWTRVVDRFRAAGADNVLWVWAPHLAYDYEGYYPGDAYVDWVATGVLNYGTVAHWSKWWTFGEIFGNRYEALNRYGKPVMIAEFGSLAVGGDRNTWLKEALTSLPARYPGVKAVVFFHAGTDATVTYQTLDWSFAADSLATASIRDGLSTWKQERGGVTENGRAAPTKLN